MVRRGLPRGEWFRNLRVGAIGARPRPSIPCVTARKFWKPTGISIETLDLSEVLGRIERMKDNDDAAQAKLAAIKKYVDHQRRAGSGADEDGQAGCGCRSVDGSTPRSPSAPCSAGPRIEENLGVVPCTVMSMMSDEPALQRLRGGHLRRTRHACPDAGIRDALRAARLEQQLRSDPNKAVCFHCSNLPKHFFRSVKMDFQEIIAGTVGKENTFGTCVGLIKPEKMSFARFSTDDTRARCAATWERESSPTIR